MELLAESQIDELTITFAEFKALEGLDVSINEQPVAVVPHRSSDGFAVSLHNVQGTVRINFVDFYR